jgi:hypothetical protein
MMSYLQGETWSGWHLKKLHKMKMMYSLEGQLKLHDLDPGYMIM